MGGIVTELGKIYIGVRQSFGMNWKVKSVYGSLSDIYTHTKTLITAAAAHRHMQHMHKHPFAMWIMDAGARICQMQFYTLHRFSVRCINFIEYVWWVNGHKFTASNNSDCAIIAVEQGS